MTSYTWQDVLSAVRSGDGEIATAPNGIPLVAVNAPFYELMQMMEALTAGYNSMVARVSEDQRRIERIRKLAEARFPASGKSRESGWIATKDMLPHKSGHYMCYSETMGVYPYHYSAKNRAFNSRDDDDGQYALEVEFWYPSPLPPVVEKEG